MSTAMTAILEVLKYIIPAIVVFLTVYYLMKSFHDSQLRMKMMDIDVKKKHDSIPVKLQTYERLTLFCERMRLTQLILRLNTPSMSDEDLGNSMMMAIQQEYEHNVAQQIYVSDNLWKIIKLAKDQNMQTIHAALSEGGDFRKSLTKIVGSREINPVDRAIMAIRQELSLYV